MSCRTCGFTDPYDDRDDKITRLRAENDKEINHVSELHIHIAWQKGENEKLITENERLKADFKKHCNHSMKETSDEIKTCSWCGFTEYRFNRSLHGSYHDDDRA